MSDEKTRMPVEQAFELLLISLVQFLRRNIFEHHKKSSFDALNPHLLFAVVWATK